MSEVSLAQQIIGLNKQKGRALTLNQLIEARKNGEISFDVKAPIDRYVYVHVTDFMPENDQITTNLYKENKGQIDDTYSSHAKKRDTVHFTVNGRVLSHGNGNWDQRKYAIIMLGREFVDKNNKNIVSIRTEDTIVDGNAEISGSFIICPQSDFEEMHRRNPNSVVIPITEQRAVDMKDRNDDFVQAFISYLVELEHKKCAGNGWTEKLSNYPDGKAIDEYYEIVSKYTGRYMPRLQNQDSIMKVIPAIRNGYGFQAGILRSFYLNPEEHGKSLEQMKEYSGEIDRLLAKDGTGIWIYFPTSPSYEEISRRKEKSEAIDKYLGIDIQDIYDGDIITTNIKRIQLIADQMKNGKESKHILQYAVEQVLQDLFIMYNNYSKRADMKDLNFAEYTKRIGQRIEQNLGIRTDELEPNTEYNKQAKDISERLLKEIEIEKFFQARGIKEEKYDDFTLRDAKRLVMLADILQNEMIESAKSGKIDPSGGPYISPEVLPITDIVMEFLAQGIELDGMTDEVKRLLETWGIPDEKLRIIEPDSTMKNIINETFERNFDRYCENAEALVREEANDLSSNLSQSYQEASLGTSEVINAMEILRREAQKDKTNDPSKEETGGEELDDH